LRIKGRRPVNIQCGGLGFQWLAVCGLLLFIGPPAWGESEVFTRVGSASLKTTGNPGEDRSFPHLEALGAAWRQDYLRTYLPGHLFRENVSYCPYDENHEEALEMETAGAQTSDPLDEGKIDCAKRCRLGDQYLAAGFLPEALAQYVTVVEKGCPYTLQGCRPRVGMLKAELAMGRFSEARSQRLRLSQSESAEERELLILIDGIFAALDRDFDRALDLFTQAGADWHLCRNLEGIAGYVLFRHQRYEDARNVFRVAMHSPWAAVREFGVLGLAECHLALGQWAEAEPLYESLAGTGSPLGLIGVAEFLVRQGKLKEARENLTALAASANQDYWKGVALAYLMSLRSEPEEWAETLLLAQRAQALVLSEAWAETLSRMVLKAVESGIGSLWESGAHVELLILAEKWRRYQNDLPPDTQLFIGKAYEEAGLVRAALEVYSRLSSDPNALFRGARLAWRCGKYQEAQALLEAYLSSDPKTHKSDAKLLLACVYARRNRLERAKECLRGMGSIRDPSLWIALGEVEISMGMVDLAIDHLKTALREASISETQRRHLLCILGVLNYRRGSYKQALRYFRLGKDGQKSGQGVLTEPIEILCLARLDKLESARAQLEELPKGPEADVVEGILDAEDLTRSLQRNGYAF